MIFYAVGCVAGIPTKQATTNNGRDSKDIVVRD
jgi:hypothetical protein